MSNNKSITRKIRILLLERTSGKNSLWDKEGFDKPVLVSLKYKKDFLDLQSLDDDLIQFATQYAEINKRQISEVDARDALSKLKTIDSEARILYYIMILDAILNNESWRNWNRNQLADYIIKREQKHISIRFKSNSKMIQSYNKLLAFCTATKELPILDIPQDIPEMIKNEIEKISNSICNKDELCAVMQLENNTMQPITPDIIGEYMVLYIIDQFFIDKSEKEKFIKSLWTYAPSDFHFFIYQLVQDKMYDDTRILPYNDIVKLMLFDVIPFDDIYVLRYYARLMWGLTAISNINQCLVYIGILEKIYYTYPLNKL